MHHAAQHEITTGHWERITIGATNINIITICLIYRGVPNMYFYMRIN